MKVLLLSNASYIGLKIAQCLAREGVDTHAIAHNDGSLLAHSRLTASFTHLPFLDGEHPVERRIETINGCIAKHGIDAVIADDVGAIGFLHGIKGQLDARSMATSPPDLLSTIYNKASFSRWMQAHDLPTPASAVLERLDQLDDAMAAVGFPLMVKALEEAGRRGIVRCDTADEVKAYLAADTSFNKLPLVLQRYVSGDDIGVSAFAIDGRIVLSDVQRTMPEDDGIRLYCEDARALELAGRLVAESGLEGVVNFDMRYDQASGELLAFECNPRFFQTVTASMWMGVNFPLAAAEQALGRPIRQAPRQYGLYMMPGPLARAWMTPTQLFKLKPANIRHALSIVADPGPILAARHGQH